MNEPTNFEKKKSEISNWNKKYTRYSTRRPEKKNAQQNFVIIRFFFQSKYTYHICRHIIKRCFCMSVCMWKSDKVWIGRYSVQFHSFGTFDAAETSSNINKRKNHKYFSLSALEIEIDVVKIALVISDDFHSAKLLNKFLPVSNAPGKKSANSFCGFDFKRILHTHVPMGFC